jgi:predicted alpha/beta superfamily hydrolase
LCVDFSRQLAVAQGGNSAKEIPATCLICKMKQFALLALLLGFSLGPAAQATINLVVYPPYYTPLIDPIHVPGDVNSWDPAGGSSRMVQQLNGSYSISVQGTPGQPLAYKYARGAWTRVETNLNGSFRPNRSFVFQNGITVQDTVWNWEDLVGWHTAVGFTHILTMDFPMPQFNRTRRIWVYLPQDYKSTLDSFPVLYMHDGQNLFDEVTTAFGTEWAIDESMEMLQDSGYRPAIIVGIDNGGGNRIDEYTPWSHPQYGGGDGEAYIDWLVQDLKPFIDSMFRTRSGRNETGLMGSSLGGLVTLYGGLQYPNTFSKLGVFSPSFWYADSCYTHAADQGHQAPMRVYLLAGGQESTAMVPDMLAMRDTLLGNGFSSTELRTVVKSDGQHSEWFWAREFPEAFKWLFADLVTKTQPALVTQRVRIVPSIIKDSFSLHAVNGFAGAAYVRLFDLNGQQIFHVDMRLGQVVSMPRLAAGTYLAEIVLEDRTWRQKVVVE